HDAAEAKQLMDLLEFEILPQFFERDEHGVPVRWLDCVAKSIQTMAPQFSAQRMVREYAERFYTTDGADISRSPLDARQKCCDRELAEDVGEFQGDTAGALTRIQIAACEQFQIAAS